MSRGLAGHFSTDKKSKPRLLPLLVTLRLHVLFHSSDDIPFTIFSLYYFAIGHLKVSSLTKWSLSIPTELISVPFPLWDQHLGCRFSLWQNSVCSPTFCLNHKLWHSLIPFAGIQDACTREISIKLLVGNWFVLQSKRYWSYFYVTSLYFISLVHAHGLL